MHEAKMRRVQRLTMKSQVFQQVTMILSRPAVNRVADQRMADRSHVDPHLVGPAGFQPAFDQRCILQYFQPFPMGHGPLAAAALFPGADDRDLLPVMARPSQRCIDYSLGKSRNVGHDRQIAPVDRMRRELRLESIANSKPQGDAISVSK